MYRNIDKEKAKIEIKLRGKEQEKKKGEDDNDSKKGKNIRKKTTRPEITTEKLKKSKDCVLYVPEKIGIS